LDDQLKILKVHVTIDECPEAPLSLAWDGHCVALARAGQTRHTLPTPTVKGDR